MKIIIYEHYSTAVKDLQSAQGDVYAIQSKTCQKLGLLVDGPEWKHALKEVFQYSFSPLAELLARVIVHSYPANLKAIWQSNAHYRPLKPIWRKTIIVKWITGDWLRSCWNPEQSQHHFNVLNFWVQASFCTGQSFISHRFHSIPKPREAPKVSRWVLLRFSLD